MVATRPGVRVSKGPKEVAQAVVEPEVEEIEAGEDDGPIEMPKSVRIGPFEHTIKSMEVLKSVQLGRIGEIDTLNLSIEIFPLMPKQRHAETLLHEIFHGLWDTTGLRKELDEDEEHAVTVLSMGMAQVIRDNPVLILWMLQNLGED